MAEYAVHIRDLNGVKLDEVPAKNLQLAWALNDAGTINFTVPLEHPKCVKSTLDPGKREIVVHRDGIKVWGGYLWSAAPSTEHAEVRFTGEGWFSRLKKRYVSEDLIYTDLDQFQIGWNLISYTQGKTGGALGITRFSSTPSGVVRTRKYRAWERPNIGEALMAFAELQNGFDFEITPDKEWKNYYPRKGTTTNVVFDLAANIDGMSYDGDAGDVASEISALGAGEEELRCIAVAVNTTTRDDYGLLEDSISVPNVKHFATLSEHAIEEQRVRRNQRVQPQLSVRRSDSLPWNQYGIGDEVTVRANKGYINIDQVFRITALTVQLSDEGEEVVGVFLDERIS